MNRFAIPFTQHLRPHGIPSTTNFRTDSEKVRDKADAILEAGFTFECEVLADDETCYFTVTHPNYGDIASRLVKNGPGVIRAVEDLILMFNIEIMLEKANKEQHL